MSGPMAPPQGGKSASGERMPWDMAGEIPIMNPFNPQQSATPRPNALPRTATPAPKPVPEPQQQASIPLPRPRPAEAPIDPATFVKLSRIMANRQHAPVQVPPAGPAPSKADFVAQARAMAGGQPAPMPRTPMPAPAPAQAGAPAFPAPLPNPKPVQTVPVPAQAAPQQAAPQQAAPQPAPAQAQPAPGAAGSKLPADAPIRTELKKWIDRQRGGEQGVPPKDVPKTKKVATANQGDTEFSARARQVGPTQYVDDPNPSKGKGKKQTVNTKGKDHSINFYRILGIPEASDDRVVNAALNRLEKKAIENPEAITMHEDRILANYKGDPSNTTSVYNKSLRPEDVLRRFEGYAGLAEQNASGNQGGVSQAPAYSVPESMVRDYIEKQGAAPRQGNRLPTQEDVNNGAPKPVPQQQASPPPDDDADDDEDGDE